MHDIIVVNILNLNLVYVFFRQFLLQLRHLQQEAVVNIMNAEVLSIDTSFTNKNNVV